MYLFIYIYIYIYIYLCIYLFVIISFFIWYGSISKSTTRCYLVVYLIRFVEIKGEDAGFYSHSKIEILKIRSFLAFDRLLYLIAWIVNLELDWYTGRIKFIGC